MFLKVPIGFHCAAGAGDAPGKFHAGFSYERQSSIFKSSYLAPSTCKTFYFGMTPREILEDQIPVALKKKPALVSDINAVIHWQITGENGGNWTMDLTRDANWISNILEGIPALTIIMSDNDFVNLRKGELNGAMAVMTGKLKFLPMNLPLAMKVARLLS